MLFSVSEAEFHFLWNLKKPLLRSIVHNDCVTECVRDWVADCVTDYVTDCVTDCVTDMM